MRVAWLVSFFVLGCSGSDFSVAPVEGDGGTDSAVADTAVVVDSGSGDAGSADTRPSDTGVPDTGGHVETGPVCPTPDSTKVWNLDAYGCGELQSKYPGVLGEAKRCNCDDDCSKRVPRDFCGCETWVSPGNDSYTLATAIRDKWEKLGCTPPPCPLIPCAIPSAAKCSLDTSVGYKVCKDVLGG